MSEGSFDGRIGPRGDSVGADLEALRERFLSYTPSSPDDERYGLLVWENGDAQKVKLSVIESTAYGIALIWSGKGLGAGSKELITVGDDSKLKRPFLIDAGDEEWAFIGNFLPIETAWLGVEDFFSDPTVPSPRLEWVETRKIRLPHLG